jgi:hypothetical protein
MGQIRVLCVTTQSVLTDSTNPRWISQIRDGFHKSTPDSTNPRWIPQIHAGFDESAPDSTNPRWIPQICAGFHKSALDLTNPRRIPQIRAGLDESAAICAASSHRRIARLAHCHPEVLRRI